MGMKNLNLNINRKIICYLLLISIIGFGTVNALYEKEVIDFIDNINKNREIMGYSPPKAIIFGEITNINEDGFFTTFEAINMRCIKLIPFSYDLYRSGEQITVVDRYFRILKPNLVYGIFGYIGASTEPTPQILFQKTSFDKLMVTYTQQTDILWSDIAIIGICERNELDSYVSIGDQITNCTGEIQLFYIPTNIMLGYWTFW
jgi:hypothetical protein